MLQSLHQEVPGMDPAQQAPKPLPQPHTRTHHKATGRDASPPTSGSDLKLPKRAPHEPHSDHHHHIPRPHRPHHHHHHHHRDHSITQSSSGRRRNSTEASPPTSRDQSRRESIAVAGGEPSDGKPSSGNMALSRFVKVAATEADLKRKRELDRKRNEELRSALAQLNSISNTTTRRLDDTYYSILEQVSTLQTTVSSLQELAHLTNQLHQEFEDEAVDLETEVKGQVVDLNAFENQQKRVDDLEARVQQGKAKVGDFAERLDAVRKRIEGFERREGEWQALISRRLRMLFAAMFMSLFIFVALLIFHYSRGLPLHHPASQAHLLPFSPLRLDNSTDSIRLQELLKEVEDQHAPPLLVSPSRKSRPTCDPTTAPDTYNPLHIFDEL